MQLLNRDASKCAGAASGGAMADDCHGFLDARAALHHKRPKSVSQRVELDLVICSWSTNPQGRGPTLVCSSGAFGGFTARVLDLHWSGNEVEIGGLSKRPGAMAQKRLDRPAHRVYITGMRIAGLCLFATIAVTLIMGMAAACCAEEDGCSGFCVCVCCGHSGLYIDPSTAAEPALDSTPVQTALSPIPISLHASPDFPPPEA